MQITRFESICLWIFIPSAYGFMLCMLYMLHECPCGLRMAPSIQGALIFGTIGCVVSMVMFASLIVRTFRK